MLGLAQRLWIQRRLKGGATAADDPVEPNLLLNDFTNGVRAYSVRKLDKDYAGYAMKVRRGSDNVEADVAFDADGVISDTSLIYNATNTNSSPDGTNFNTWAGNTAYLKTWYDQSGNGNDATQATAGSQPKIVSAGALLTKGVTFDGTDDFMSRATKISASQTDMSYGFWFNFASWVTDSAYNQIYCEESSVLFTFSRIP